MLIPWDWCSTNFDHGNSRRTAKILLHTRWNYHHRVIIHFIVIERDVKPSPSNLGRSTEIINARKFESRLQFIISLERNNEVQEFHL